MARIARYLFSIWLAVTFISAGIPALAGHDYEEPVEYISAEQVKRLLDIGEDIVFIDLRPAEDFAKGHLPTARSIPIDTLGHRVHEVPTSGRLVLYCGCPPGERDEMFAFTLMRKEKFRNVTVLESGFAGWLKRGYPVETASR